MSGWERGRWWQVRAADGSLWCETSSEREARSTMRPGDTLWKEWRREEIEWREAPDEVDEPVGGAVPPAGVEGTAVAET